MRNDTKMTLADELRAMARDNADGSLSKKDSSALLRAAAALEAKDEALRAIASECMPTGFDARKVARAALSSGGAS